jgi:trans-2,3-dihydro-3-hydroxyanthranilate isomerase
MDFAIADVFATGPLTGNALAVVPDADALDVATMRALAREFNQSETTFRCTPTVPAADWRLRSFTAAGHEVGGAGHNALGAWLWLAHAGRVGAGTHAQQLGDDVLAVEVGAGEPVLIRQGDATGRPSRLRIDVAGEQIRISATGLVVATGRLTL